MKSILRKVFSPLLRPLEAGTEAFDYKPSHRWILLFVSGVFSLLALLVVIMGGQEDPGYLIPVSIFGLGGLLGLIVGLLGEDRAIAKIWGSGK